MKIVLFLLCFLSINVFTEWVCDSEFSNGSHYIEFWSRSESIARKNIVDKCGEFDGLTKRECKKSVICEESEPRFLCSAVVKKKTKIGSLGYIRTSAKKFDATADTKQEARERALEKMRTESDWKEPSSVSCKKIR
jgi:hypothetical protein